MRGPNIGMRIGARIGAHFGVAADGGSPMATVTRDATSLIYVPSTAAEWNTVLAVANDSVGAPGAGYLCQAPSGNLADFITGAFPLTAAVNGITYAQAVAGWSRLGILFNDGGTGTFTTTSASLPDVSTTSIAALAYFVETKPTGGNRVFMSLGTSPQVQALTQITTGFGRLIAGSSVLGVVDTSGTMSRPWIAMHNRTGSIDQLYNDAEKLPTPTFMATATGKQFQFGAAAHAPGLLTYLVLFFGAAAERTSTQWKTLLQTLGWSPAFS